MTLRNRYLLRMMAPSALQIAFNIIFVSTSGHLEALRWLVPADLGMLIALNLLASVAIFAPIQRHLRGGTDRTIDATLARLRRLPRLSSAWWVILSVVYSGLTIGAMTFALFSYDELGVGFGQVLGHVILLVAIIAIVLGFFAWYLIENFCIDLRIALYESNGVVLAPGRGHLALRIGVPLMLIVLLPLILIYSDATVFVELRRAQGYDVASAVVSDIIGALFAAPALAYFVVDNLRRPTRLLARAQRRVAKGDLTVRVPVVVDHEIGELAAGFNDMVAGLAERAVIREALGKYVSEGVAEKLLGDRERLKGDVGQATVLFTDIAGFTTVTEGMAPERVIELLNAYLAVAMQPIADQGGVVLNLMGDSIFAAFNMPANDPDHATKAIRAALAIQARLGTQELPGGARLSTRIGINTGPVVAGAVGDASRLSYTLLGDTVNTASRIEKLCKDVGASILVAESTRLAAPGFAFEKVGALAVRGRQEKVTVYTVAG